MVSSVRVVHINILDRVCHLLIEHSDNLLYGIRPRWCEITSITGHLTPWPKIGLTLRSWSLSTEHVGMPSVPHTYTGVGQLLVNSD